jgi:hypothetical protein
LHSDLKQLFTFRDEIAHSQPDHGNRYQRLRRHRGQNFVLEVTPEQIRAQIQLGEQCHSALDFIPNYIPRGVAAPPDAPNETG